MFFDVNRLFQYWFYKLLLKNSGPVLKCSLLSAQTVNGQHKLVGAPPFDGVQLAGPKFVLESHIFLEHPLR